jgi:hypothetical protein
MVIVTAVGLDPSEELPEPIVQATSSTFSEETLSHFQLSPPTSPTLSAASLLTDTHWQLVRRLRELKKIEDRLIGRLSAKGETEATSRCGSIEFAVLASSRWKSAFRSSKSGEDSESAADRERENAILAEKMEEEEIAALLREAKEDIEALWNDPVIRSLKSVRKVRLEESPGLLVFPKIQMGFYLRLLKSFLDCLQRTTVQDYVPTNGHPVHFLRIQY